MSGSPVLALDLGSHCGWALWDGARMESGIQVFDLNRGESPGLRFVRFNAWLSSWPPTGVRPVLIVYEQTHHHGVAATEVAAGFATRVQEFCAREGIEHAAVHTATLKKWTTGKGNSDKAAMLAAVAERWKVVESDDEADAIALLYFALSELVPREEAS